jgi:hypothetical protein
VYLIAVVRARAEDWIVRRGGKNLGGGREEGVERFVEDEVGRSGCIGGVFAAGSLIGGREQAGVVVTCVGWHRVRVCKEV